MRKKILSIVLTLCMLLGLFPFALGTAAYSTVENSGETWNQISTPDDLIALMNDSSLWTQNYVLTQDIDLSTYTGDLSQKPIGDNTQHFKGKFNGADFEIKGVNLVDNSTAEARFGFFGYIENAEIKNLTISGTITSSGTNYVGGLVGLTWSSATIENCVNNCDVTAENAARVGGIIGLVNVSEASNTVAITVRGCTNNGDISGKEMVGGIIGRIEVPSENDNLSVTVEDCENNGSVTGSATYVGGIIGISNIGTSGKAAAATSVITGCRNTGAVSGKQNVAGICGYLRAYVADRQTVSYCANYGEISAQRYLGGITGYTNSPVGGQTVTECMNAGTIIGTVSSAPSDAGGITGIAWQLHVTNCLNTGEIRGYANSSGIVGRVNGNTYSYTIASNYTSGTWSVPDETANAAAIVGETVTASKAMVAENNYYSAGAEDVNGTYVAPAAVALAASFPGLSTESWIFTTNGPELRAFHEHTADARAVSISDTQHQYTCTCNEYTGGTVENHAFNDQNTCTVCGYFKTDCTHANTKDVVTLAATCTATGLKNVVCATCNYTVKTNETVAIDPNNHAGKTLSIKYNSDSGKIEYVCDGCGAAVYSVVSPAADVYVKADSADPSGDQLPAETTGTSEAAAFGTFDMAMAYAAASVEAGNENVTLHLVGTVPLGAKYATPAYSGGTVTITGGTLHFSTTGSDRRFFMNGDVTFENMTFTAAATAGAFIFAQNHTLVLGEGIVMGNTETLTTASGFPSVNGVKLYVCGGFESTIPDGVTALDTNVTIRSGDYWFVGGWNRNVSSENVGSSKLTIGKTNPDDYLFINIFTPYSTGNGLISAASDATVIFDGDVDTRLLFVTTQNTGTANVPYTTNFVLKGDIGATMPTINNGLGMDLSATTTVKQQIINVYVDERVDTAVVDSYAFFGDGGTIAADSTLTTIGATVNRYTYAQYCTTALGGHFDTDNDNLCDECGASTLCTHSDTELVVVTPSTCTTAGTQNRVCKTCFKTVEENIAMELDPSNHEGHAWRYDAASASYKDVCTGCSTVLAEQQTAPVLYVDAATTVSALTGKDTNDGLTADTPLLTIDEAVKRLAVTGGTVMLADRYVIASNVNLPAYRSEITFTAIENANGTVGTGFVFSTHGVVFNLNGPTKFERIIFNGVSSSKNSSDSNYYNIPVFAAHWNNVTFGERLSTFGAIYFVAGANNPEASDDIQRNVTLTFGPTVAQNVKLSDESSAPVTFFDRIFLGDRNGVGTAANKNVTLNLSGTAASIWTSTTSGAIANAQTANCETTVNLTGSAKVQYIRSGDANTNERTAFIDNVTLNLKDNSTILSAIALRNVKHAALNISTAAEGRTEAISKQILIAVSANYSADGTETASLTYGSHSLSAATPLSIADIYEKTEDIIDECDWDAGVVTTQPTREEPGVRTYTCTTCSRTKTEEEPYVCTDHTTKELNETLWLEAILSNNTCVSSGKRIL